MHNVKAERKVFDSRTDVTSWLAEAGAPGMPAQRQFGCAVHAHSPRNVSTAERDVKSFSLRSVDYHMTQIARRTYSLRSAVQNVPHATARP